MSLELINAVAGLATVTIVAVTAVAALIQLRHLRAGNQISALLSVAICQSFRHGSRTIARRDP